MSLLYRFISQTKLLSPARRLELYPPFRAMRIRISEIEDDWSSATILLPLNRHNRNPGGGMFGGAMASLADPVPALMCARLFPGHSVWTRAMTIDFRREGRSGRFRFGHDLGGGFIRRCGRRVGCRCGRFRGFGPRAHLGRDFHLGGRGGRGLMAVSVFFEAEEPSSGAARVSVLQRLTPHLGRPAPPWDAEPDTTEGLALFEDGRLDEGLINEYMTLKMIHLPRMLRSFGPYGKDAVAQAELPHRFERG